MKNLLLSLTMLLTLLGTTKAQTLIDALPEKDGAVVYESVVEVPGKTKDIIYLAAKKWMLTFAHGSAGGVKSADKDQGQLLGSGSFTQHRRILLINSIDMHFIFKIQVDCKDNKYRVRFYDITYITTDSGEQPKDRADWSPINAEPIETFNKKLKKSKNKTNHQNAAAVDAQFKEYIADLATSITKFTNDDF